MTFTSDDLELHLGLVDGGELGDDLPGRGFPHYLLQKRVWSRMASRITRSGAGA
jgi:hypothetical protein